MVGTTNTVHFAARVLNLIPNESLARRCCWSPENCLALTYFRVVLPRLGIRSANVHSSVAPLFPHERRNNLLADWGVDNQTFSCAKGTHFQVLTLLNPKAVLTPSPQSSDLLQSLHAPERKPGRFAYGCSTQVNRKYWPENIRQNQSTAQKNTILCVFLCSWAWTDI